MHSSRTSGFTLVELAIVLVIIGLLVGGIMVGRELMYQAGLSSLLRDIERTRVSIRAFEERFSYLPGDLPQATRFWGAGTSCPSNAGAGTCDGDGNRLIAKGVTTGGESTYLWQHLALAGLIEGRYNPNWPANSIITADHAPRAPIHQLGKVAFNWAADSAWFDSTNQQLNNRMVLLPGQVASGTLTYTQNMAQSVPCADAKALEDKVDDLMPGQGRLHSARGGDCPSLGGAGDGGSARYRNPPQYPSGGSALTTLSYTIE